MSATGAVSIGMLAGLGQTERAQASSQSGSALKSRPVLFVGDGHVYSPADYAATLVRLTKDRENLGDRYGSGGAVEQLETTFANLTSKEAAIYMPTGTMANQLAVKVLSGNRSKVMVQGLSHYYRDEADAAQLVHGKRLIPVGGEMAQFTLEDLRGEIDAFREREYFPTEIGAISIENPLRRAHEAVFDIGEIARISRFAKENGIGMHLDGARLFMAAAYSGVSIKEYASHFDTVYISLYKYLGAGSGAILCGTETVIDQMPNLIKIYGGNTAHAWDDALVALSTLEGFEERFAEARDKGKDLFRQLNTLSGLRIEGFPHGCNAFKLSLSPSKAEVFRSYLLSNDIILPPHDENGNFAIKVNQSILGVSNLELAGKFVEALARA